MKNILIVDDCSDVRFILTLSLRSMGHRVIEAENGEDAINLLKEEPIDLILMDIMMPRKNGFQVIEKIRDLEGSLGRKVKVVLITAKQEINVFKRAMEIGVDGLITKPITANVLKQQLNSILSPTNAA